MSQTRMQRRYSFYALLVTALLAGVLFFRVMQPFLMPLILGAVLALLFRPFHQWLNKRMNGRRQLSAGIVTLCIFLIIVIPLGGALALAVRQLIDAADFLMQIDWRKQPVVADVISFLNSNLTDEQWEQWQESSTGTVQNITTRMYDQTLGLVANLAGFVVGLCIALLSVYYFLAEGPAMLRAIRRVSPLDNQDEFALFCEFEKVCRGVILATVVCALVQAVLAGVGFAVLGVPNFWLLAGVTVFTSMIPFVGAAAVWMGVSIWLAAIGEYGKATIMAVYGTVIVSTVDNLIRAYVIHGTSRLHPLIALISVIGALQTVGFWGVFVGPLIAAFFYALLKIMHTRIDGLEEEEAEAETEAKRPELIVPGENGKNKEVSESKPKETPAKAEKSVVSPGAE